VPDAACCCARLAGMFAGRHKLQFRFASCLSGVLDLFLVVAF
jgi:hypothetical protein